MAFPSSNLFLWHMKSPLSVPNFLCLPFLFNNLNLFYEIVNTLYKDIITILPQRAFCAFLWLYQNSLRINYSLRANNWQRA